MLTGSAAQSHFGAGGAANDTLDGRGGNDVMYGQQDADRFVLARGMGGDVVVDFAPGADKLVIAPDLGMTSFAQVQAACAVIDAGRSWINLGQGDFVMLFGVQSLNAGDVVFG